MSPQQDRCLTGSETPPTGSEQDYESLFAEANHRIANNLSLIVGMVRMHASAAAVQDRCMSAQEVGLLLDEVTARIETVARLHQLLAVNPQLARVDVAAFLRDLCAGLVNSVSFAGRIDLTQSFSGGCTMRPDQMLPLALIVNEVVTNAIKYAHPTGVQGRIEVDCRRLPDGGLTIEVVDDGIGLPEGFDPEVDGGLGCRVVRALAKQLGATIHFDSTALGLRFRLMMPVQAG